MSTLRESSKGNESSDDDVDIEGNLLNVQSGVLKLKQTLKRLRKENVKLRDASENDRVLASGSVSDDDTNLQELRIQELEKEVKVFSEALLTAKKENIQLWKDIEDLRLKAEVDELYTPTTIDEEIDPAYRMRKILRKFSDLMLVHTISPEKKEKCPICYERLELEKCSGLHCNHIICNACLPGISRAATRDTEALRCPKCRRDTPREELKLVHMTETKRWDTLAKLAGAWMAFDRRREWESSEEDSEENFITDGTGTAEVTSEDETKDNQTTDDASIKEALTSLEKPEISRQTFDFSTTLKRKRTKELETKRSPRKGGLRFREVEDSDTDLAWLSTLPSQHET